jgi:hypothetical protein
MASVSKAIEQPLSVTGPSVAEANHAACHGLNLNRRFAFPQPFKAHYRLHFTALVSRKVIPYHTTYSHSQLHDHVGFSLDRKNRHKLSELASSRKLTALKKQCDTAAKIVDAISSYDIPRVHVVLSAARRCGLEAKVT